MIDAHAHLADPQFADDLDDVLTRARAAGVRRIVAVGETLADAERLLVLAQQHPMIAPCAGLYPTHLDRDQLQQICTLIERHRDQLFAVGEIGLDRWMIQDTAGLELQRELFVEQVAVAIRLDLPVNVHSRSAGRHTIAALREAGARRVLLHAYDGRPGGALEAVRAGYCFSIPPSVVRSVQKQRLVRALPLESLLLETDSPALGAVAGTRNEPAALRTALETIAQLKQLPVEQVREATNNNALQLFGPRLAW